MASLQVIISVLVLFGVTTSLNPLNALTGVQLILPEKVLSKIPSKLSEKIKELAEDDDRLTTSYTFPKAYKTTLYKDPQQLTTLVNLFATRETKTYSAKYFDPGYQILETSTTELYEALNATVAYQTTPLLNSSHLYPVTVPFQSIGYATPEYQYEILVYPTQINVTEMMSTTLVNYTVVDHVDNNVPFL